MNSILLSFTLSLLGVIGTSGVASADQIEPADREVKTLRVTYVEPIFRKALYVELNDGATYKFKPCIYEDGSGQPKGCYWDANGMGNGIGNSFVVLPRGEFVYSPKIGAAR